jgi:hypothetical protein
MMADLRAMARALGGESVGGQVLAPGPGDAAVEFRAGIMLALVRHPPCVAIDFDDELQMARHAEAAWPCAKITRIREGIEEERSGRGAQA